MLPCRVPGCHAAFREVLTVKQREKKMGFRVQGCRFRALNASPRSMFCGDEEPC